MYRRRALNGEADGLKRRITLFIWNRNDRFLATDEPPTGDPPKNDPPADPPKADPPADPPKPPTDDGKTFTQADLDKLAAKVRAEEKAKAKAEADKAALSETERLKLEKEEADKKASDATSAANQRAIRSEAKLYALSAGVKAERIDTALRLADLTAVTVGDDGEPNAAAIKIAIDKVLADVPELKGEAGGKGGTDLSGSNPNDKPLTDELIAEMGAEELSRRMPEIQTYYVNKRK